MVATSQANPTRDGRTLADAVDSYRTRHTMTQEAMADDFGVPVKAVQNWEGKDGSGKSSMAKALIRCLDRL